MNHESVSEPANCLAAAYIIGLAMIATAFCFGPSTVAAEEGKTEMLQTQSLTCEFLLYNNPAVRGPLYNPLKEERGEISGYPALQIQLREVPAEGPTNLSVEVRDSADARLFERTATVTIHNGRASCEMRLEKPLRGPATWAVRVTQGAQEWSFSGKVRLHKLYGRLTDFEGKPLRAFVAANGDHPGGVAQADENGEYVLWLPETYYPSFFVADADYAQRTLEVWVHDFRPQHDLKLDMSIGQIELYELHAWRGIAGLKVDFIPMSIGLMNRIMRVAHAGPKESVRDTLNALAYETSEGKPYLCQEDISVELDGTPLTIEGFWERAESLNKLIATTGGRSTRPQSRPEYTLQLSDLPRQGPPGATQVLRVTVTRRRVEGDTVVVERGEGYYLGLRSGWSVSGGSEG